MKSHACALGCEPQSDLLGAVVVPTNEHEGNRIIGNLALWGQRTAAPFVNGRPSELPALVFSFDRRPESDLWDKIRQSFVDNNLRRYFADLHFLDLELKGERRLFKRWHRVSESVSNDQFLYSIRAVRNFGKYVFLMRSDCGVVRPNWLGRLLHILSYPESFWVMGSAYRGPAVLDPSFRRHIDGNAIYASGDPSFQNFLTEFWEPRMRRGLARRDRRLAWDCILERAFTAQDDLAVLQLWRRLAHKFRYTDYIQNYPPMKSPHYETAADIFRKIKDGSPETYIVHNSEIADALITNIKPVFDNSINRVSAGEC